MTEPLWFYTEKKPGLGEDANPIAEELKTSAYLLGVFDGLGGAGGRQFILPGKQTPVTGAYLASRYIRDAVLKYFNALYSKDTWHSSSPTPGKALPPDFFQNLPAILKHLESHLTAVLKQRLEGLSRSNPPSRLRSSMLKSLPTTMVFLYTLNNKGVFIWAGDSRGYILDEDGLHQYTKDDLESGGDALDNLLEDSPMSNYISEAGFALRHRLFSVQSPSIILTATDGCFGFYDTPMHFEYIMLLEMQKSSSLETWKDNMVSVITQINGDDATMSMLCIGNWADFTAMQNYFKPRLDILRDNYIDPINNAEGKERDRLIKTLWEEYKKGYDKTVPESDSDSTPLLKPLSSVQESISKPDDPENYGDYVIIKNQAVEKIPVDVTSITPEEAASRYKQSQNNKQSYHRDYTNGKGGSE
jgi:hypothetical protein